MYSDKRCIYEAAKQPKMKDIAISMLAGTKLNLDGEYSP